MEKNHLSQASPAGVATRNRRVFLARFSLLALFLAFSAISFQPQTSAQAAGQQWHAGRAALARRQAKAVTPGCAAECYAAFDLCENNGGSGCDSQLQRCLTDCGLIH
ncbi:MAG TPA: hypothetical protein VKA60_00105 [Blastocatellia bacterium]|nr:hypothetical protein [Blastocatellia bacterium]